MGRRNSHRFSVFSLVKRIESSRRRGPFLPDLMNRTHTQAQPGECVKVVSKIMQACEGKNIKNSIFL